MLEGDARAALVEQLRQQGWTHTDPPAQAAQQTLSKLCTPFRYGLPDDEAHDVATIVRPGEGANVLVLASGIEGSEPPACLAASAGWTSDQALIVAMRAGILPDPQVAPAQESDGGPVGRLEPASDELLRWSINTIRTRPPAELVWSPLGSLADPDGLLTWFQQFDSELSVVSSSVARDMGGIIVGDTSADFCLAMLYDRLLGYGLWLTQAMVDDDRLLDRIIHPGLEDLLIRTWRRTKRLRLTSASIETDVLTPILTRLAAPSVLLGISFEGMPMSNPRAENLMIGEPSVREGRQFVAIREPLGVVSSVPVVREDDDTVTMQAPLPTVLPAKMLHLKDDLVSPYWLVEVSLRPSAMPEGRGLRPHWLLVENPREAFPAQVRASRGGLTYRAQSQGLILAGSNMESRIARPRLRQLGVRTWVEAMANDNGLEARLSNPGTQAQLIASRLGGRANLLEITSSNLTSLRRFAPVRAGLRSDVEFPDHDGVILGVEPFLTRTALERVSGSDARQVGRFIDTLTSARLLRRGLIVDCAECQRPSFVSVDELGQSYHCKRCAGLNELTSRRWRSDSEDPRWFYDLHPSFRELVGSGGDVVVLAAAYLQRGAQSYFDVAEMEFLETERRIAEIDLIALVDGRLFIGEVKSTGRLAKGAQRTREIAKKLRIAEALRVDAVILATADDSWSAADLAELTERARHLPGGGPDIEVIAGL